MIKCIECGDEFSYGRKIYCCNCTYFGTIFEGNKKNHKWNCITSSARFKTSIPFSKGTSVLNVVENKPPILYNWNCETSDILKNQEDFEEKEYILMYE